MSKYLTTLALIVGGIFPIIMDVGNTHLLNPDWESHARVHLAWMLSTNFLIFLLGMYLLWIKEKEITPALLGLCIHVGFVISAVSMPLYGGASVGQGLSAPSALGLPLNIFVFSSALIVQLVALALIFRKRAST